MPSHYLRILQLILALDLIVWFKSSKAVSCPNSLSQNGLCLSSLFSSSSYYLICLFSSFIFLVQFFSFERSKTLWLQWTVPILFAANFLQCWAMHCTFIRQCRYFKQLVHNSTYNVVFSKHTWNVLQNINIWTQCSPMLGYVWHIRGIAEVSNNWFTVL